MQYITSDSDSCFQVFHVVVEMVLKESGDKEIAVIIALLLAQSYWHSYFDTGVDQIVRQQLCVFEKLVLLTLSFANPRKIITLSVRFGINKVSINTFLVYKY